MKIDGLYDAEVDIAWVRFESYDPHTAVAEETDAGLRELDPSTGKIVGLEFWGGDYQAAGRFPSDAPAAAGRDRGLVSRQSLRTCPGYRDLSRRKCWTFISQLRTIYMRQPRRYPNRQAGVEELVELLFQPVVRRQREGILKLL